MERNGRTQSSSHIEQKGVSICIICKLIKHLKKKEKEGRTIETSEKHIEKEREENQKDLEIEAESQ